MINAGGLENLITPQRSDQIAFMDNGIFSTSRPSSPLPSVRTLRRGSWREDSLRDMMPSETETRFLINHYFRNTGLLFPYIHELSFLQEYEQFKLSGFQKTRRTWLGLLNMILAMSTNTMVDASQAAEDRIAKSHSFYRRAMALCDHQIFRGTTVETGMALFALDVVLVLTIYSSVPHSYESIFTRHTKVGSNVDNTWLGCQGSFITGPAFF